MRRATQARLKLPVLSLVQDRGYPRRGTVKVRASSGNAMNGEQGVEEQDSLLTLAMSETEVRVLPLSVSEASPLGCCVRVDEREERCVRYTGWEDGRCKW